MQRGLFLQQRKRNRRNVQMTLMTLECQNEIIRMAEQMVKETPGLSGLVAEMIQATGDIGTQWILYICNGIVKEGCIPEDWKSSVVLPIY